MSSANSVVDTSVEVVRESVVPLAPRRAAQATPEARLSQPEFVTQAVPTFTPPQATPSYTPPQAAEPAILPAPSKADQAFVGVLAALTAILAARLLLLLSIGGAFVLALLATRSESYPGLAILIAFCCLTVVPMTYLDVATHKRGGR